MRRPTLVAVAAAVLGCGAIAIGVFGEFVHLAPGFGGRIVTEWGGDLNRIERRLPPVGLVGLVGAVATLRWKRLAAVPVATGGVVLFVTVRAVLRYARFPGLYTKVPSYGPGSDVFVLGVEPFLLGAGGVLLVGAGIVGWRSHADRADGGDVAADPWSTV